MSTNELKFLLKLFDCSNHRAYLTGSSFRNFPNKEKICQQLAANGLVDFTREITAVKIASPGAALMNLPLEELPISDIEFRVLDRINRYPGIQPKQINIKIKDKLLTGAELNKILLSFGDRGLIFLQTQLKNQKAEVWLTQRGLECLEQLDKYFQSWRTAPPEKVNTASIQVKSQIDPPPTQLTDEAILQVIRDLDKELGTDNYLPIFYLRQKLQPSLSREELDRALYRLQRGDKIELSSLQEGMRYTPEQIEAAIYQGVGRRLFFIILN